LYEVLTVYADEVDWVNSKQIFEFVLSSVCSLYSYGCVLS